MTTEPPNPTTYIVHLRADPEADQAETDRNLRHYLKRLGRGRRMRCVRIEKESDDDTSK